MELQKSLTYTRQYSACILFTLYILYVYLPNFYFLYYYSVLNFILLNI